MAHARRFRTKRPWVIGCFVAFTVMAITLIVGIVFLLRPTDDGTATLRAKGYPTTISELEARYPEPPPGENAAEYYAEAGTILKQSTYPDLEWVPTFGGGRLPTLGTPISEDMLAEIAEFLEYEAYAFELIDEASQFDRSRDPAFNQLGGTALIELYRVINGQYLRTRYFNSRGDTDTTLSQFKKLVHLARSQSQVPMEDALIPFHTCIRNTLTALEFILDENDLTHDQLTEIDGLLDELLVEDALVNNIVANRCRTLDLIDAPQSYSIFNGIARTSVADISDAYLAVAEAGLPDHLDEFLALLNHRYSWFEIFGGIFAGPLHHSVYNFYESQARVNLARMAIAIQQLRLDGAETPNDWAAIPDALKGSWPLDPFSGKPFRYKRTNDGFMVYSVGVNIQDDGGQREQNLDTTFVVLY